MNQHIVTAYDTEIKDLQSKIITMGGIAERMLSDALEAIERQRHAAGGATEHLANRGWGAAMVGGSADDTEHEIVSDRNSRGTDDLVQHAIDRNVKTHHVAKEPVGSGKLLSH